MDLLSLRKIINSAAEENMFITRKKNKFIGCFIDDNLIGIVGHYIIKDKKMIGFVSAYVHPNYRNLGIYSKLSKYRLDYCKYLYPNHTIYVTANNRSKHQLEEDGFAIIEPQYRMILKI